MFMRRWKIKKRGEADRNTGEVEDENKAVLLLDGVQASLISLLSVSGVLRLPLITILIPAGGMSVSKVMKTTCIFDTCSKNAYIK